MCTCNKIIQPKIVERLEQHEQTISQLIQMVALTNRQLIQIVKEQNCNHVRTPTS